MRIVSSVIFFSYIYSLLLFVLIPPMQCKFLSNDPPSKWDLLEMFLYLKNNYYPLSLGGRIFKRIRKLPIIQIAKTVNDIVEPVVTAAEILLLLEELHKKKTKGNDDDDRGERKPPIHLTTNDQIIVFSGNNKLEVNHLKKHTDSQNIAEEGSIPIPEQIPLQEETKIIDNDDLQMDSTTYGSTEPMLLSSKVRHSVDGDENYFQMNFLSNDNQDFNLVRDLPKHFVLTHSNPVKVEIKRPRRVRKHRKRRRKH